jgi:hypothetical protein
VSRRRLLRITALILASLGVVGWAYFRQPPVSALCADDIRSAEVIFAPGVEDNVVLPGASTNDPKVIAALLAVLQSRTETQDHKCASRGSIILRRSLGKEVELRFLPGHHAEWYEFRYAQRIYRVPRGEFVAAMREVGVTVPLECR